MDNKNIFKYKGGKYLFTENNCSFLGGFRFKYNGITIISVSKGLPNFKKKLVRHKLIAGKKLKALN